MHKLFVDGKPHRFEDCGEIPSNRAWHRVKLYDVQGRCVSEHTLPGWFITMRHGRLRTSGCWYTFQLNEDASQ